MRSSRISASSALMSEGSIFSAFMSNLPVNVTLTRPPPAWPVASSVAISSCMAWNLACISFALPIRPRRSFIGWSSKIVSDFVVVGGGLDRHFGFGVFHVRHVRNAHVDDLGAGEAREDGCDRRIGLGVGEGVLALGRL